MKKTEIIKIKGDWQEVVDDCRVTIGKEALGKEPSRKFKREILISEHSPIRSMSIKWKWVNIPSWVATHFSRHKWECFIKTQRTDRTGTDRNKMPQDAPVIMSGDANTQHLIDMARKRLCRMASRETRKYMEDLKKSIHEVQPEVADVLVPNCVYRCGCPEPNGCKWFDHMASKHPNMTSTDIQQRYDTYNEVFYGND
jgi:hypothetical protein